MSWALLLPPVSGVVLCLAALASAAEPVPAAIHDPAWWVARARAEAAKIADPEERHLIGSLAIDVERKGLTPEEREKSLQSQLAELRAKVPPGESWRYELASARLYGTAKRYRDVRDALQRGLSGLAKQTTPEQRKNIEFMISSEADAIATDAVHDGEYEIGVEIIAAVGKSSVFRDEFLRRIASHQAPTDLAAAEATLRRMSPERFPREFRRFLISQCKRGGREAFERAIGQLLQDAPALKPGDLASDYFIFVEELSYLPQDIDPTLLRALADRVTGDAGGSDHALKNAATGCLVAILVAENRIAEAQSLVNQSRDAFARQLFTKSAVELLVRRGQYDDALALDPSATWAVVHRLTETGRLDEALAALERGPKLDEGHGAYAVSLAKALATRGQWDKVERILGRFKSEMTRISCLIQLANEAQQRGDARGTSWSLNQARDRLRKAGTVGPPAGMVGVALVAAGDLAAARQVAWEHGTKMDYGMVLAKITDKQLDLKDAAGFQASIGQLEVVVEAGNFLMSAQPRAGTQPASLRGSPAEIAEGEATLQIQFALLLGKLYVKAGQREAAKAAVERGFRRAGEQRGSLWRIELYAELFLEEATPQTLADLAGLVDVVPHAADRAVLAGLGAALAAKFRKDAQPKVIRAVPAVER